MNGYANSKNDEELIKMLEEMQDELDSKDNTIADLEKQLQTSANSSAVSMLKSKIQEQADEIVSLNEHIGKLNSADLILKENGRLKEENSRIVKETETAVNNARKEISAEKNRLGMRTLELQKAEQKTKDCQALLDDKIANQNEHIRKEAELMSEKTRKYYTELYRKRSKKLDKEYETKTAAHSTILYGTITYSIILTFLSAVASKLFVSDFKEFFATLWKIILLMAEDNKAYWVSISETINNADSAVILKILYVFAVLFVSALMIILAVAIIYMIYRYIRWYKQEIADYISLFVAFSTFAISTTLSEYVKEHLSINLIALNIIIHLVYTGFRHYYRECRKNRGYYYQ